MERQTYDELCFENDEINRKWAEQVESLTEIIKEQDEHKDYLKGELSVSRAEYDEDIVAAQQAVEKAIKERNKLKEEIKELKIYKSKFMALDNLIKK